MRREVAAPSLEPRTRYVGGQTASGGAGRLTGSAAFYMLGPASQESDRLRDFIERRGLSLWFFDSGSLDRAFELMEIYADHPMDLADASLVVSAERLGTRKVFTVDRRDFETYKVRRGHRHYPIDIVPAADRRR